MARSDKESEETKYVLKKGGADIPVDACKGWFEPCEYCDKRFNKWIPVNDELYEKIPEKPGFFMIALKNKGAIEVVSIVFNAANVQISAYAAMDKIKEKISDKKSKATKSEMIVRWMVIKKLEDKENSVLCAHWYNNGILPKFLSTWPGINILEDNDYLIYSKQLQKWCYPQKDPVWRKPKPQTSRILEEVEKCNFKNCEFCDFYFTPWQNHLDIYDSPSIPNENGIVMFSVVYGKSREIFYIAYDRKNIVINIRNIIKDIDRGKRYICNEKFKNKNAIVQVRWMLVKNVESDNLCFLYAHWLNSDPDLKPCLNYGPLPGQDCLNKNKHFVIRECDKKWLYEIEAFKQTKFSKAKNKKHIHDQIVDELDNETF